MARFNPGDQALVNYAQIATITSYDESLNWFSAEVKTAGSVEIISGHISNTTFQAIEPAVAEAVSSGRQDDTRDGVTNVGDSDPEVPDSAAPAPKHSPKR